ncbi:MAG: DUF86 domain-containing protein [Patescibacteria group bacterium]
MTIDYILLSKKIELLKGYIAELKDIVVFEETEILKDSLKYHSIERLFQLSVDTMIDINIHLIRELGNKAPDDLTSTFVALAEIGILEEEFAEKIKRVAGLRNMIVHRYEKLDKPIFIKDLKTNFSDFEKYLNIVITLVKES